jgi:hypothetical protein
MKTEIFFGRAVSARNSNSEKCPPSLKEDGRIPTTRVAYCAGIYGSVFTDLAVRAKYHKF